jgi:hypothetical protein
MLLLDFDMAYRVGFEVFGLPQGMPEIELHPGSVFTWLSGSVAGIGLLVLCDVATGGATLPVTAPIYAKAVVGGTMVASGAVNYINEQRKKWAEGSKGFAESDKARAEADKAAAETVKIRSGAFKAQVEAWAVLERTGAEGQKIYAEADKLRAEAEKLRAETMKLVAENTQQPAVRGNPPPAAQIPVKTISAAAKAHRVGAPVATLAINIGLPILAEAESAGVRLSSFGTRKRPSMHASRRARSGLPTPRSQNRTG